MSYSAAIRSAPWTLGQALLLFIVPWVLLPVLLLVGIGAASIYFPGLNTFLNALDAGSPFAAFALVVVDVVGSLVIIGYFMRKYKVGVSALGLKSFSIAKALLYVFLLFISFGLLVFAADILVKLIYPAFDPAEPQTNEFTKSPFPA